MKDYSSFYEKVKSVEHLYGKKVVLEFPKEICTTCALVNGIDMLIKDRDLYVEMIDEDIKKGELNNISSKFAVITHIESFLDVLISALDKVKEKKHE